MLLTSVKNKGSNPSKTSVDFLRFISSCIRPMKSMMLFLKSFSTWLPVFSHIRSRSDKSRVIAMAKSLNLVQTINKKSFRKLPKISLKMNKLWALETMVYALIRKQFYWHAKWMHATERIHSRRIPNNSPSPIPKNKILCPSKPTQMHCV